MNANEIPIVGQPCQFVTWFPTVVVSCNCGATPAPVVVIVGAGISPCPACGRPFALANVAWNARSNELNINVAVVAKPPVVTDAGRN